MITTSESIVLLVYISIIIDGKINDSELKNLKLRILSYPIFKKLSDQRFDELRAYLMEKWKSSSQDEVSDHIINLIPDNYYKTAFCFVLEVIAGDLEINESEKKFVDLIAKKMNINEETKKSLMDSVYYRYIPGPLV